MLIVMGVPKELGREGIESVIDAEGSTTPGFCGGLKQTNIS